MKTIFSYLLAIALSLSLIGCGDLNIRDQIEAFPLPEIAGFSFNNFNNGQTALSEAAPPILIRKLGRIIDNYEPQISILEPSADKVLNDTKVSIKLKVTDFPVFKDENLEMGPHLHLIVDNEPYRAIYSVDKPIVLENLEPGTHSLRVFAVRPWHESFKNKGAYAETIFHILTKTQANNPDSQIPLLTYSRPKGTYGAEPIMLDFYLSHLPSEEIIKNSSTEGLPNWRVKATVNGESFILDQWQPVYLTGFKEGNNWIQLELLDNEGNSIENTFNNTVRLITYDPETKDSLARIVTGEIELQNALAIVDPDYEVPVEETVQAVSKEVFPEAVTDELKVVEEQTSSKDQSEVIRKPAEPIIEITPESSQIIKQEIFEQKITQPSEIPANDDVNEEQITEEVENKTPEVTEEQITEEAEAILNNSEVIIEEVPIKTLITPKTSEIDEKQLSKQETITKDEVVSTDNSTDNFD